MEKLPKRDATVLIEICSASAYVDIVLEIEKVRYENVYE